MEDGAFGGSFGKYDMTTHNQNSRNTGYKNTLNVDSNFSTTLGANFTTVVGANFSTTGGFNIPVTIGGKVELIWPYSIKWTRGFGSGAGDGTKVPAFDLTGYDYDFKNCATQVKVNDGMSIYNVNGEGVTNYNFSKKKGNAVAEEHQTCYNKALNLYKENMTLANYEGKKVVSGELSYKTMTTTVDKECKITAGALKSTYLSLIGNEAKIYSLYNVVLEGNTSVCVKTAGTATVNGSIIKVG